jgi:hypothetical protein
LPPSSMPVVRMPKPAEFDIKTAFSA